MLVPSQMPAKPKKSLGQHFMVRWARELQLYYTMLTFAATPARLLQESNCTTQDTS